MHRNNDALLWGKKDFYRRLFLKIMELHRASILFILTNAYCIFVEMFFGIAFCWYLFGWIVGNNFTVQHGMIHMGTVTEIFNIIWNSHKFADSNYRKKSTHQNIFINNCVNRCDCYYIIVAAQFCGATYPQNHKGYTLYIVQPTGAGEDYESNINSPRAQTQM